MADVGRSMVAATSSSRYTALNFWRDPRSGNGFQIQVEVPQSEMTSLEDVENLPVMTEKALNNGISRPLVSDLAKVEYGTVPGEVDRYNMQRVVSLTDSIDGKALGQVLEEVRGAVKRAGAPPRGVVVFNRGQIPAFEETSSGLRTGLLFYRRGRLLASGRELPVVPSLNRGRLHCPRRYLRSAPDATVHWHYTEHSIVYGRDHGHRHLCRERDLAGHLRRACSPRRRICTS